MNSTRKQAVGTMHLEYFQGSMTREQCRRPLRERNATITGYPNVFRFRFRTVFVLNRVAMARDSQGVPTPGHSIANASL